jgi:putative DNA primase/helicase
MSGNDNKPTSSSVFNQFLDGLTDKQKMIFRSAAANGVGNRDRLKVNAENNFRYVRGKKKWIHYNSGRWQVDEDNREITDCYIGALEATHIIAKRENNKPLESFANRCLNNNQITSDLVLAAKDKELSIRADELDKDPLKLGTPNGVIDLRTGKPCTTTREEYITKSIAVDYDPDARCKLWEEYFIPSICMGDKSLEKFLQQIAGILLTGSTKEEMLFFFYGGGRNGKGTFTGTIAQLLKDYYYCLPSKFLEQKQYGNDDAQAAQLMGVRFALTSETGGSRVWDMERVNDLTGGDTMQGCAKYENPINWEPTHKIIVSGNNKPKVNSEGEGFWARMALTPFLADYRNPKDQKKELKAQLKEPENLKGILNWCLKGCLDWQAKQHGLIKPKCVIDATKEFRSDSDLLKDFYETEMYFDPKATIEKKDAFKAYQDYCDVINIPLNRRYGNHNFYRKILARDDIKEVKIMGFKHFKGMDRVANFPISTEKKQSVI